jgi:hypothetical protein
MRVQRNDGYRGAADGLGCCYWNGPFWPFETSKALTGIINVLNNYPADTAEAGGLGGAQFWMLLGQYTDSHTTDWVIGGNQTNADLAKAGLMLDGAGDSWIAESGCADDKTWTDVALEGYWYNHATFNDIVLSGVVGLQPSLTGALTVNPLVPAGTLDYFAVDGVLMHGKVPAYLMLQSAFHRVATYLLPPLCPTPPSFVSHSHARCRSSPCCTTRRALGGTTRTRGSPC